MDLVRGRPAALSLLVLAVVLVPLVYIGYRATFSYGGTLDDEGYFLISLREWVDGGSLYDEVYTQYGPALFVLLGAPLGALDLLDTDGGRLVHLLIWLSTALLMGAVLLRIGRNLPVAAAGTGLTFYVLASGLGQTLHPGPALCLLLVGIVAAPAFLLPRRPGLALALIGAFAAGAALMKVNVGGLASIAILFSLLLTSEIGRAWEVRVPACLTLAVVPFALMADSLSADWALRYAVVVSIGAVAVGLVATALPPSRIGLAARWRALAAGAGAVVVVVIAVAILTGSSPSGLVRGVVLDPLEFDDLVDLPLNLDPGAPLWGAAWLAAALLFRWKLAGRTEWSPALDLVIGTVSMLAGLGIWIALAEVPNIPAVASVSTTAIWVAAPLAWIVAAPPPRESVGSDSFLRTLIPVLAVMGLLQAYPTGGIVGWSMFLLVLVGGLALTDGIERVAIGASRARWSLGRWRAAATVAVIAFGVWFVLGPLRDLHRFASTDYDSGVSLDLVGAQHVRLKPVQADQYRDVAAALGSRCDNFLSLPGLNSFYLWTGIDPPTALNAGAWPWLLDSERQQRVVESVDGIERLCLLRSPLTLDTWSLFLGEPPERPLLKYVDENFESVRVFPGGSIAEGLELLERRSSAAGAEP